MPRQAGFSPWVPDILWNFITCLELIEKNNYHNSILYGALKRKTFNCSQRASSYYYFLLNFFYQKHFSLFRWNSRDFSQRVTTIEIPTDYTVFIPAVPFTNINPPLLPVFTVTKSTGFFFIFVAYMIPFCSFSSPNKWFKLVFLITCCLSLNLSVCKLSHFWLSL